MLHKKYVYELLFQSMELSKILFPPKPRNSTKGNVFTLQYHPCKGNPLTFFAYMGLLLSGTNGICIGAICRNRLQAILLSFMMWFVGIFPAGIITPVENMKPFLQKMAQGIPTTHFNIAANGIFQRGLGFAVLWPEAVKLVGIGSAHDCGLFSRLETVQAVNRIMGGSFQ